MLFAYLVLNRHRQIERSELLEVLWPRSLPTASESSLNALISKLRKALGSDVLRGRSTIAIALDGDAVVDVEAAREGLHRSEVALAQENWFELYAACNVAQKVARRRFLLGVSAETPWVEDTRRQIAEMLLRALEYEASACLNIAGTELRAAERSARELVQLAPYRESGYGLLMQALAKQGNVAEALRVFEECRQLLREELGVEPGPDLQALHGQLLTY